MEGHAATNAPDERPLKCDSCGSQVRPGIRFCTRCGLPVETGRRTPEPDRPKRDRGVRRVRPLPIMAGVIVAVGLAVGIILVAHPFGHGKLAAAKSVTTPRGTVTALSDRTPSAGSPTPLPSTVAPSPSAPSITQQQAAMSLAALLSQSGNDRQAVSAAFNDVAQCGPSLSQDAQTFQTAVSSHRQLLSKLAKLPGLSALPSAMVQDLSTAWQSSASADGDYAKWAQDQLANGCSVSSQSDPNYMAANAPNQQATSSKTAFAQLWNQLAQTYDLPNYSQSDL